MRPFLALLLALLAFQASAQTRVVQIIAKGENGFTATFESKTNELVTVETIGWSNQRDDVRMRRIIQGNSNWAQVQPGEMYLGAAMYQLSANSEWINDPYFWAVFRVETVNSTGVRPETVLVLPAGSGASVIVEGSGNLFDWSPLLSTNLPTVGTNQFFRIRLSEGADQAPSQPGSQAPKKN